MFHDPTRALNDRLTIADWTWWRNFNLQSGIYGPTDGDVRPRVIQLNPGQPLFRWADTKCTTARECAAGAWWSTKLGAKTILERASYRGVRDTSSVAQEFSNVLPEWNDATQVVSITVMRPIKCFIGVGKKIVERLVGQRTREWDSREHQVYIPNMTQKSHGRIVLNPYAESFFRINWVRRSDQFDAGLWSAVTGRPFQPST